MGKIIKIDNETIIKSLENTTRQYFADNLSKPQEIEFVRDERLEIGISSYPDYNYEPTHKLMDIWLCHFAGGGFVGIESGDNRMSEQRLSYNEAIKSAKLEELYRRAYKILHDNRDFFLAVQKELLEHETLLNSDLAKIRESCI